MRTIHQITTAFEGLLREEDRALTFRDDRGPEPHNYLRSPLERRRAIVDLARELIAAARHLDLSLRQDAQG